MMTHTAEVQTILLLQLYRRIKRRKYDKGAFGCEKSLHSIDRGDLSVR